MPLIRFTTVYVFYIYTDDYYTISVFLLVCLAWGICSLQHCIPTTEAIMQLCLICAQDNCILPASHHKVGWAGNILKQLCTFVQRAYVCLCV